MALFPTDPLSLGNAQRLIQARSVLTQTVNLLNQWLKWINQNPTGATPQQVLDNLGTSAGGLYSTAQAAAALIGAATGTTPTIPAATVNPDGTVTLA